MAAIHLGVEPSLFGEKSVLSELSKLPDDWHIFYSLGFVDRNGFDRQREIDFVLFHPDFGLVFIEVKGGSVRFENGTVRQWLDNHWKDRNPIQQLNGARRVCLEYLSSHGVDGFIPARNLYVFPTTQRPATGLSQELSECSFFGDEPTELSEHIISVATGSQKFSGDGNRLIELLKPCVTYDLSPDDAEELTKVTQQLKSQSLIEIIAAGGASFNNVEAVKSSLGAHRESLQALWWKVVSARSEIEQASGETKFQHEDALVQIMRETSNLLNNSAVEIGVFGQVKRGKSTLVNALVGREVSATGMTPKTAVPVTIEYSPEESGLIVLADGSTEFAMIEQAIVATTQADRKRRAKEKLPAVDRVVIRLPLNWLESGVKIVDTPGLSDPSNTDVYENFAIAELNRVGAAIFVISYPPGPENHEVKLISSLATQGLAKIFFVVNVYSDIWKQKGAREEIANYLQEVIEGTVPSDSDLHNDDRHVFLINLKMATDGIESGSQKKVNDSGLSELQLELEAFLTTGALDRITNGAGKRLLRAAEVIEGTLKDRSLAIHNPDRVKQIRDELHTSVTASNQALDSISNYVNTAISRLTIDLETVISDAHANHLRSVSATTDRDKLRNAVARLSVESATTSSVLISRVQREMIPIIEKARNELFESFSVSSWTFTPNESLGGLMATHSFSGVTIADYIAPTDYKDEARGAGAIIGAILGGGGGIALAATGPIGLAIGGVLGWLFADSIKGMFKSSGNSREASPQEVQNVISALRKAELDSRAALTETMKKIGTDIRKSLGEVRTNILRDSQAELTHLESLLSDEKGRRKALDEIAGYARELSLITGTQVDV
jgi:ribosome biogenesis GTPase A